MRTVTSRYAFAKTNEAKTPKSKVTAKTENQTLAADNENRIELIVSNVGTKDAFLACGATAAADEGVYLKKEGGSVIIVGYTGVVACITKEGESVLSFSEV